MTDAIFLIGSDKRLTEMTEQPYAKELDLQQLLAEYPRLLVGEQFDPDAPRRWLLVTREMGVPGEAESIDRWSLDHLFLDQDGVPTLVEVKRSSDTRLRREVVGQMLDYAANAVVYWPPDEIRARFIARCEKENRPTEDELLQLLGDEGNPEAFWTQVRTNLQAGRVRLVFVADLIPPELRRIIEFLNGQLSPAEVLGLELKQYVGRGLRTLVPRVFGQTAGAEQKKGGSAARRKWDEKSFFEDSTNKCAPEVVQLMRELLELARNNGAEISWGTGQGGTFIAGRRINDQRFSCWSVYAGGTLRFPVWSVRDLPTLSDEDIQEIFGKLSAVPGVTASMSKDFNLMPLNAFLENGCTDTLKSILLKTLIQ